ncbi:type II toxin-antitoxin system VapC family toxin [Brasilonema sp. UFV-L1]|uniref:type II toxin-antitoxin system VapC family toxin n=1 Tax=Brasilonema sp. UFV-L1 TaxID=2234130 RepID=UPI00145CC8D5|nr:type II toxin-antitoxin system VapC family toxin [Brasilonema sp. UFV-L1]NMG07483.1 DNA-binding protein [Brasilonema sp. UFV-L1]
MSETVYIETSLVGYLTARPSNNLILMANLEITRRWWENRRSQFTLYISQVVLDEAAHGDPEMALKRLEILQNLSVLELTEAVQDLGEQFLTRSNLPSKASDDAIHIAAATVHALDYLLTWNCKHIANAQIQRKLAEICLDCGYKLPTICTPYELMGE